MTLRELYIAYKIRIQKLFAWYLHCVTNMASDRMHKMSIVINSLGCDASLLRPTCSRRSERKHGSKKTLFLIANTCRYVLNIIPAIMILTRKAKWLAVPVIVRTILPLAVHFARRFFVNRRWISAAGLLEALSFPSRDRNFDYFPDDHLTSKRSVFSSVDGYGCWCGCRCRCSCCASIYVTLLRSSTAWSLASDRSQRRLNNEMEKNRGWGSWGCSQRCK